MSAGRIALVAAVATAVFWGAKAVAIWSAGGLDQSALEGPLFVLGLISLVVAFAALGAHLARARPLWQRVVAAILVVLIGGVIFLFVEDASGSLVGEAAGWVQEEIGLWVAALLTLVLTIAATRSPKAAPPTAD